LRAKPAEIIVHATKGTGPVKEILKNIQYWHIKIPVFLPCFGNKKLL